MTSMSILFVGLLLGMKHATEADHLAAMATLVTRENSLARTLRLGAAWGMGHTLTLMLFGGAVLALGKAIPREMEQALESMVGLMLIALGADVLRRLAKQRVHFHVHRHEPGTAHVHAHSHAGEGAHRLSPHRHSHAPGLPLRAVAVGMMHGMAGSAALVLLSLEAVQSWAMGILYIAMFGIGSIAGMAILSVAICVPLRMSAGRLGRLHNGLTALTGIFSCALGAWMVIEIGLAGGLLPA
jgi:hypothetical protein